VQETYLQAWRGLLVLRRPGPRCATWLYRIAHPGACLKALERRARRPFALGGWVAAEDDPEAQVGQWRDGHRLVAADPVATGPAPADPAINRRIPGEHAAGVRRRAAAPPAPGSAPVLILRDVLAWRTSEVAELIDASEAAVNSALQRARAQLAADRARPRTTCPSRPRPRRGELLDQYAHRPSRPPTSPRSPGCWPQDAVFEMPPVPTWYAGARPASPASWWRKYCGRTASGCWRPPRPTGSRRSGLYLRNEAGEYLPHALQVLTLGDRGIARIVKLPRSGPACPVSASPERPPALISWVRVTLERAGRLVGGRHRGAWAAGQGQLLAAHGWRVGTRRRARGPAS